MHKKRICIGVKDLGGQSHTYVYTSGVLSGLSGIGSRSMGQTWGLRAGKGSTQWFQSHSRENERVVDLELVQVI